MTALRLLLAIVTAVAMVSGCAIMNKLKDGVSDPMTPEETKAQVIAAARDVVKALQLKDVGVTFRYEACSDEGKPPYRGLVQIDYAHAPTYEGSQPKCGVRRHIAARRLEQRQRFREPRVVAGQEQRRHAATPLRAER